MTEASTTRAGERDVVPDRTDDPAAILAGFGWFVQRATTPGQRHEAVARGVAAGCPGAVVAAADLIASAQP